MTAEKCKRAGVDSALGFDIMIVAYFLSLDAWMESSLLGHMCFTC